MKYKVIKAFRDGQDEEYTNEKGTFYPRVGYKPAIDRAKHLVSLGYLADNKKEDDKHEVPDGEADETSIADTEEITEENTNDEIMDFLDGKKVEYPNKANKKELLALVDEYYKTHVE